MFRLVPRYLIPLLLLQTLPWLGFTGAARADLVQEVAAANQKLVEAFATGKAADVAAQFATDGELIDENGVVFQGREEIQGVLQQFFEKFPKSTMAVEADSIRPLGATMLMEEGSRLVTTADGSSRARLRYAAVRTKVGNDWLLASMREVNDDAPPTPYEQLQPLAWLVGEWVNEGSDAVVNISYRWSEDRNYILGEFKVVTNGVVSSTSSQRIGWDAAQQKVHSWIFESEGGFSNAVWTPGDNGWVLKSHSTLADGQTGSATVVLSRQNDDHFSFSVNDRVVGNQVEPNVTLNITRRPPVAQK